MYQNRFVTLQNGISELFQAQTVFVIHAVNEIILSEIPRRLKRLAEKQNARLHCPKQLSCSRLGVRLVARREILRRKASRPDVRPEPVRHFFVRLQDFFTEHAVLIHRDKSVHALFQEQVRSAVQSRTDAPVPAHENVFRTGKPAVIRRRRRIVHKDRLPE